MKAILMATNLITLAVILFMTCNPSPESRSQTIHNSPARQAASGGKGGKCPASCGDYAGTIPAGIMPGYLVEALSRAYYDDVEKSHIDNTDKHDATSLVFDLEKIKNFIWHIDSATCRAGCTVETGIRFYYIKYDMSKIPGSLQEQFAGNAGKHSLAMVPVYKADGEWYDFDYRMIADNCDFNAVKVKSGKSPSAALFSINADNHGGLAPPPGKGYYPTLHDQ